MPAKTELKKSRTGDKNLNDCSKLYQSHGLSRLAMHEAGLHPLFLLQKFTGSLLKSDIVYPKILWADFYSATVGRTARPVCKTAAKKREQKITHLFLLSLLHILDTLFYKFTDFFYFALNQSFITSSSLI